MGKKVKELQANPMKKQGESAHCIAHNEGQPPSGRIAHDKLWEYTRRYGGETPLNEGVAV